SEQLPAWQRDEFTAQLRAHGHSYHDRHPFHQRMNAGELTRDELARWVANRFAYQQVIPRKDAAILANCDEQSIRRDWISRITDHDGSADRAGGIQSWIQLAEAIGVPRDELLDGRHVLPAVQFACDAYLNFCRTQPWIIGVASSLTELFGPDAIRVRLAAMEANYPWIDRRGFDYFRERLTLAPRDASYALELVLERCTTRALQAAAVDALSFKCDMLWAQLDAIDLGDTRPKDMR
ncbi:MAG: pqqC, pyrroloquinoline-qui synthase, partial [Thermoleophilia bacterium]|nr:pqqC, pyrroloquinoline-qui synthase [Thermoleophilia bacterium]